MGYLIEISRQKEALNFFKAMLKTLVFIFAFFSFFLYDLFTNTAKKLEVDESNPIMENFLLSFFFG